MPHASYYVEPGVLTDLGTLDPQALATIPVDPVDICRLVHTLVIQPNDAKELELPTERFEENQVRPAAKILERLFAMDPASVDVPREPKHRVIGTCRHFAVLSCAFLRYRAIAARARCGFATYFQPGQGLDHWITEWWNDDEARWVRTDSEILGQELLPHPEALRPGEFLSGGEAWTAFRRAEIDASTYGVYGTDNWGAPEIQGNAVRDLAALNRIEMLPWDEWGRMDEAYRRETGFDYEEPLDVLATVCRSDELSAVTDLYARDEFRVPPEIVV